MATITEMLRSPGLLGFAQGLLGASQVSPRPVSFGEALGAGIGGMQQAQAQALQQQMGQFQLQEMRRQQQQAIEDQVSIQEAVGTPTQILGPPTREGELSVQMGTGLLGGGSPVEFAGRLAAIPSTRNQGLNLLSQIATQKPTKGGPELLQLQAERRRLEGQLQGAGPQQQQRIFRDIESTEKRLTKLETIIDPFRVPATKRDKIQAELDLVRGGIEDINRIIASAEADPTLVGLAGTARRGLQRAFGAAESIGLFFGEAAPAVQEVMNSVDARVNSDQQLDEDARTWIFDPNVSEMESLERRMAYMQARTLKGAGRMAVDDVRGAAKLVKLTGFTGSEPVINRMKDIRNQFLRSESNLLRRLDEPAEFQNFTFIPGQGLVPQ